MVPRSPVVGKGPPWTPIPVGVGRRVRLLLLARIGVRVLAVPVEVRWRRRVITVLSLLVVTVGPRGSRPGRVVPLGVVHLVGGHVGSARGRRASVRWWSVGRRAVFHTVHPVPAEIGREGRKGWHARVLLLLLQKIVVSQL